MTNLNRRWFQTVYALLDFLPIAPLADVLPIGFQDSDSRRKKLSIGVDGCHLVIMEPKGQDGLHHSYHTGFLTALL